MMEVLSHAERVDAGSGNRHGGMRGAQAFQPLIMQAPHPRTFSGLTMTISMSTRVARRPRVQLDRIDVGIGQSWCHPSHRADAGSHAQPTEQSSACGPRVDGTRLRSSPKTPAHTASWQERSRGKWAPVPLSMPMIHCRVDSARSDVTSMSSRIRPASAVNIRGRERRHLVEPGRQPRGHRRCCVYTAPSRGARDSSVSIRSCPAKGRAASQRARRPLPASRQPVVRAPRAPAWPGNAPYPPK